MPIRTDQQGSIATTTYNPNEGIWNRVVNFIANRHLTKVLQACTGLQHPEDAVSALPEFFVACRRASNSRTIAVAVAVVVVVAVAIHITATVDVIN